MHSFTGRELYSPPERPNHEPSLSDDASLIAATLAGDSAAFGRLVQQYQDRLYNSLLRVLGSADDAAELRRLRQEVAELRRANEILKTASAFFAQAELDRRLK